MQVPFIVYADLNPSHTVINMPTKTEKSYTKQYQKHIPSGFCYHIKCFDDTHILNNQLLL